MSPLDAEIIRRKLVVIMENLIALESVKDISVEEYVRDLFKRKAVERLLQELIEAAIDINIHIIAQSGSAVPDDYFKSFIKAGELKILSVDLAEKLAPSAGLRNRLVHEYDSLEHSLVLEAVKIAENLFPEYMKQIENYISGKQN